MNTLKKQQGLTLIAWILILVVLSFAMLCAFKVIPLYAENRYVVAALRSLVDPGTKLEDMTDAEIKRKLSNFYAVNNVRGQGPQNIVIKREAKRAIVTIDYEGRTTLFNDAPLVRTLDVVVKFDNHLDSTFPDRCCTPISQ